MKRTRMRGQGSIIRWQPYTGSAEALKAAGLEE